MRGGVVIGVAANGAWKCKRDAPALPIEPAELVACATDCLAAGATYLHFHLRVGDGRHLLDVEQCRAVLHQLRAAVGDQLLLQVTTESGGIYSLGEQMAFIDALDPVPVSIGLREFIAVKESVLRAFLERTVSRGFWIQYILYSDAELKEVIRLQARGVIPQINPSLLFVLGSHREQRMGQPKELLSFLGRLPRGWPWSVCCFGDYEHQCTVAAALFGGHMRVGFENNTLLADGSPAANNSALVRQAVASLRNLGFAVADVAEARTVLGQEPSVAS